MITILSPAKNIDEKKTPITDIATEPEFIDVADKLAKKLARHSKSELQQLLSINDKLTALNYERYKAWTPNADLSQGKQAILSYSGDVYRGLNATNFSADELNFAQKNVRILSGLYGILRPLDVIHPYRLEMSTKIGLNQSNNLHELWKEKITNSLSEALKNDHNQVIINLASQEYVNAIDLKRLNVPMITPVFKELKGDEYRMFFVFVKRARGMMTRFIIENKITQPEELKQFDANGYAYTEELSDEYNWVFTR